MSTKLLRGIRSRPTNSTNGGRRAAAAGRARRLAFCRHEPSARQCRQPDLLPIISYPSPGVKWNVFFHIRDNDKYYYILIFSKFQYLLLNQVGKPIIIIFIDTFDFT